MSSVKGGREEKDGCEGKNWSEFEASAPGRICLFGEHQDYLGWPAVVMAIDLRCRIRFTPREDRLACWSSPALGLNGSYALDTLPSSARPEGWASQEERNDHLLAALIEGRVLGWSWPCGWDARIESDIPVQAGCSSSTALISAWTLALAWMADVELSPSALVTSAHRSEVLHFDEAGGRMDHQAIAHGGLNRVHADGKIDPLTLEGLGNFLLGDSGVPKDTQAVLARCNTDRSGPGLSTATAVNKAIEEEASAKLSAGLSGPAERIALGKQMNEHHRVLSQHLEVSTEKIDGLCAAARASDALGAKINGSGGGGCMFAWFKPEDQAALKAATESMAEAGAVRTVQVRPDRGAFINIV